MNTYTNRFFRACSKRYQILIISVILIVVSAISFKVFDEIKKTNVQELNEHWTFVVKDRSDHYIVGETQQRLKNVRPNNTLIMQQQLEMKLHDPQLVVRTNHQWVSIFVGEKLIYKYDAANQKKRPGLLQTTIHLPSNYRQEKLRIVTKTPYEYYTGIPAQIFIGEAANVSKFFILHSLPQVLLLMVCSTFIVLLLILLFLKPKTQKKSVFLSLLLIGFTFLVGIQSIVLNVPASTLFGPKTLSVLYNLTSILIPVFLTSYYLLRTNKYQRYYLYGISVQFLLLAIGLLAILTGYSSLPIAVQVFSGFNVFITLYTSAIALAESADHNHFYTICSPGIIMAAFIHCFFYIQLFAGAANLTTDWPLILFSGLMVLICGYQFKEDLNLIRQQRINQQEEAQRLVVAAEKQQNLLATFKLLAEKEALTDNRSASLTHILEQMDEYYQRELRKQAKFFSCQINVKQDTAVLKAEKLYLLIQLFEKFLSDSTIGAVDILIRQNHDQLVIESKASTFARHSFDKSFTSLPINDSHQELEQAVKRSAGEWHWQNRDKQQYFKITLAL